MSDPFNAYPYQGRYPVLRALPDEGRDRAEVLAELTAIAGEEDQTWQSGQCSGTIYLGDTEHYDFLGEAFSLFSHQNALQRDMCPSATRFEGCLLYTSDAADERSSVDLGGRRIIKKKK